MTTDNKLNADIHTLVGLIAGLRVSGGDENLLHLLVEQLKTRQDELNTTSSTKSAKLSPQDLCQWITETEMLIDEMEGAPASPKLELVLKMLKEVLEKKRAYWSTPGRG